MESTINLPSDPAQSAASRLKSDLANGAKDLKDMASGEIRNLMADVEDLVSRVAAVKDPDVALVRNKVIEAIIRIREINNRFLEALWFAHGLDLHELKVH